MKYFPNLGLLFESIVNEQPNNIALKYQDEKTCSFKDLNEKANSIAKFLIKNGIAAKDVVAIISDKSLSSYATMVACLKIGAIYTNFDKDNPLERLAKNIETCAPKIVCSDIPHPELKEYLKTKQKLFFQFEEIESALNNFPKTNLSEITERIDGGNPAYIMFTSGSTGVPKGAVISHASIINFIDWARVRYEITSKDILTNVNPLYFDNSVFDFYSSLFNGAAMAPIKKEMLSKPIELINIVDKIGCTIWFSVPSLLIYLNTMRVLTKDSLKALRIFTFGGEGYPKQELKKLFDVFSSRAKFINVYGPTECTCICSSYEITGKDFADLTELPSLGGINPNFQYLILDELQPSNEGELFLLGPNVALGYYGDKEKSDAKFIQNPLNKTHRDIGYLTGDLVEERDGLLYFRGRVDNQIKHMGYRIELEEIEQALNAIDGVNQSAVVYQPFKGNTSRIVAFVASAQKLTPEILREQVSKKLPDYMIPHAFQIQESLPKNANGKVDKKYLKGLSI